MQGVQLSRACLNKNVEEAVVTAFRNIHDLSVLHCDVRPENVLVLEDQSVRIIDFEQSCILCEDEEQCSQQEDEIVKQMLHELKFGGHREQNGHSR